MRGLGWDLGEWGRAAVSPGGHNFLREVLEGLLEDVDFFCVDMDKRSHDRFLHPNFSPHS
jgi:hypothetical protein